MTGDTRQLPHPDVADIDVTEMLFALSDDSRLDLVRRLADGPLTVAQCQAVEGQVPKSTLSHHLRTLREAGLVRNDPAGRQRTISLRRTEVDARFPGLLDSVLAARRRSPRRRSRRRRSPR